MGLDYSRPMTTNDLVFGFLTKALLLNDEEADEASESVMKAERLLETMQLKSTLYSEENRRPLYKTNEKRIGLRKRIFEELKDFERLDDDEKIALGVGGARPKNGLKEDGVAVLITGLPASGKSSIAGKIADIYGAYIVDSDFAKRKIPEFKHEFGASVVHEESSLVTFGSMEEEYKEEYCLYEFCIANGYNMVVPKIGSNCKSLRELRDSLIEKGYAVHLVLVSLDRQESCKRALYRYLETNRYVPLGLVFDVYANEPILTYYRVREDDSWASVEKLSTYYLREKGAKVVHLMEGGPVDKLKKSGGVA